MGDYAKTISDLVMITDTKWRGTLLRIIADNLMAKTQYYTGSLFRQIALAYGEPKDDEGSANEG